MLVEVLAAIGILGLLVASLGSAVQRACDSAIRLRDDAAVLSSSSSDRSNDQAWEWGPSVERAVWAAGPRLTIAVREASRDKGVIGIWADGWLLGEWDAPGEGTISVGPAVWEGIADQELVVRVRCGVEPWGPPCRTVVPDQYGNVGVVAACTLDSPVVATGFEDARVVSHLRYAGALSLRRSVGGEPVAGIIDDTVAVLRESSEGLRDLVSGDAVQSWLASENRRLDVYW